MVVSGLHSLSLVLVCDDAASLVLVRDDAVLGESGMRSFEASGGSEVTKVDGRSVCTFESVCERARVG